MVRREMTDAWKRSVLAELKRRGLTRMWLAEKLGTSKSQVTEMLTKHQTSALVDDVCRILKLDPPTPGVSSDEVQEAVDIIQALDDDQRKAALTFLRLIKKK